MTVAFIDTLHMTSQAKTALSNDWLRVVRGAYTHVHFHCLTPAGQDLYLKPSSKIPGQMKENLEFLV